MNNIVNLIIRGMVVSYIEIYFRSTHLFRTYNINENFKDLYPIDFIKFVNSFKMKNIFKTGKHVKGCGKLKCGGVPVFEGEKHKSSNFSRYIRDYEYDMGFYLITKDGNTISLDI